MRIKALLAGSAASLSIIFAAAPLGAQSGQPSARTLTISSGKVEGLSLPSGVEAYLGIPYAAPPVRELRWREPQPVQSWPATFHADRLAPQCVQPGRNAQANQYSGAEITSEDCLYLNVWTRPGLSQAPVIVYIHGGAFFIGSGNMPIYGGETVASEGAVYVSLNYRLGALGFLAHPELSAESPNRASGNYASLDQIAALKWIRENIAQFGGDPNNVTIVGQSAGGSAVLTLQASPLTRGLIHRAVGMSGGGVNVDGPMRTSRSLVDAEQDGVSFQRLVGAETLAAMRALPVDRLTVPRTPGGPQIGPSLDGYVLPASVETIFSRSQHNDIPLIVGFTRDEGMGGGSSQHGWATAQTTYGRAPVYAYEFTRAHSYVPGVTFSDLEPATAGAYHTSEVPFWLGTLESFNRYRQTRAWTQADRDFSSAMTDSLIAFARSGDPATPQFRWSNFDPRRPMLLETGGAQARMVPWAQPSRPSGPVPAAPLGPRPLRD
jgi:para-nitrobenzyl esterase